MAHSAHKTEEELKEHFVDEATLEAQARKLAELIRESKHMVAFTGAGLSTSAGIPDFRGPEGVWTMRAQGKQAHAKTSTIKAFPTPGHMALVALAKAGYLQFLISQNTDGIHRRSGFPVEKLAELHGNSNLERCNRCPREYLRDFHCRAGNIGVHEHYTGRHCVCGGRLQDTIVNFGENLPKKPMNDGFAAAEKADLMLVLGSSLRVTPAADMPHRTAEKGRDLVICNLQETPMDPISNLRIFAKTDDLMIKTLKYLDIPLPSWKLRRYLKLEMENMGGENGSITLRGVEPDGTPASIFSRVKMWIVELKEQVDLRTEPFVMKPQQLNGLANFRLGIQLQFMGHFKEPPLDFERLCAISEKEVDMTLEFDPQIGTWTVDEKQN